MHVIKSELTRSAAPSVPVLRSPALVRWQRCGAEETTSVTPGGCRRGCPGQMSAGRRPCWGWRTTRRRWSETRRWRRRSGTGRWAWRQGRWRARRRRRRTGGPGGSGPRSGDSCDPPAHQRTLYDALYGGGRMGRQCRRLRISEPSAGQRTWRTHSTKRTGPTGGQVPPVDRSHWWTGPTHAACLNPETRGTPSCRFYTFPCLKTPDGHCLSSAERDDILTIWIRCVCRRKHLKHAG